MAKRARKTRHTGRVGQPPKFEQRFCEQAYDFCVKTLSVSDTALGRHFGVSRETIRTWRTQVEGKESSYRPEFAAALTDAREEIDSIEAAEVAKVKKAVIKAAKGYGYTQKKIVTEVDDEGQTTAVKTEKSKLKVHPNITAAKLVLSNMGPEDDRWYDVQRQKQEHSGNVRIDGLDALLNELDGGPQLPCEELAENG